MGRVLLGALEYLALPALFSSGMSQQAQVMSAWVSRCLLTIFVRFLWLSPQSPWEYIKDQPRSLPKLSLTPPSSLEFKSVTPGLKFQVRDDDKGQGGGGG